MLKKAIIGASVAILMVLLVGYGMVYVAFSGGLSGAISNLKSAPDPESPELRSARDEARKRILLAAEQFETAAPFLKQHSADETSECRKGQNNWKVHEGFAYRCTLQVVVLFGFDGEFRERAIALDGRIRNLDWEQFGLLSMEDVLHSYYDRYYGKTLSSMPGIYLVSNLPMVRYARSDVGLDVKFSEKATLDADAGQTITDPALREILHNSDYALIATFQQVYFEN